MNESCTLNAAKPYKAEQHVALAPNRAAIADIRDHKTKQSAPVQCFVLKISGPRLLSNDRTGLMAKQ